MLTTLNIRYNSNMLRLLNIKNNHANEIGTRIGAGFQINTADEDMVGTGFSPKEKSNIAFNASLFMSFKITDTWLIQPEINVMINNGMEISGQGYLIKIDYNTLDIPLLIKWNFIQSPVIVGFFLGPYLSLPIGNLNLTIGQNGSSLDISGITGGIATGFSIGYKIGPGNIIGDIRFMHDFSSLYVREDFGNGFQNAKICLRRVINIALGYELSL